MRILKTFPKKLISLLSIIVLISKTEAAVYTVNNTNDSGPDSFREALLNANSTAGYDEIQFAIPAASYQKINLTTILPDITDPVFINGWSQGGAAYIGVPLIELVGTGLLPNTYGLSISASGCTINGISIGGFISGISVESDDNLIIGNYIGILGDGTVTPNTVGINLVQASGNLIGTDLNGIHDSEEKNIVSGNATGVRLSESVSNQIKGNFIGTDALGTSAVPNTGNGIELLTASDGNTIGGSLLAERNILSANGSSGIIVNDSDNNWIKGNYIGLDKSGTLDLGNVRHGIYLNNSSTGTIVGSNGDGMNDLGERNVISCNDRHADNGNEYANIRIVGPNTNNTIIAGNFIGISAEGKAFAPNGGIRGIQVFDQVTNLLIGGSTPYTRNVISGLNHFGIEFIEVSASRISGNYIGTDTLGTTAIPNVGGGIQLWTENTNNTIGTNGDGIDDEQEGNLISGNTTGYGILFVFSSAQNFICGNRIGTDVTGTLAIPNLYGIRNYNCNDNTYGGLLAAQRNIISGNTRDGLLFDGTGTNNKVINNFIGVNSLGTTALSNGYSGIAIFAPFNYIGDGTEAGRNIISGNLRDAIYISATNHIKVQGNYIGTDVNGMLNIGNTNSGVRIINGSKHNIVGTDSDGINDATEGNLISCNDWRDGSVAASNANVLITSANTDSNFVAGNFIGTDNTGMAIIANAGVRGIQIADGTANMIGGRSVYARNIVAGQTHTGIEIDYTSGDTVMNNYVGTNKAGTAALKNRIGIVLYGNTSNHVIGTNGDGMDDHLEGNLISGNSTGIQVNSSNNIKISGNLIGTDISGAAALPNEINGIEIYSSGSNTVGGSLPSERNIISGNSNNGIALHGTSTGNKVFNNYIGTDITGTSAIGNEHSGIYLNGTTTLIGDGNALHRNIISGNLRDAIYLNGAASTANKIQGNYIGTDVTGMFDLGNLWTGIEIIAGANANFIGSDEDGVNDANEGNLISCNYRAGGTILGANANIKIESSGSNNNLIRGNLIGTDMTGENFIGVNGGPRGIQLRGGTGTVIGGTTPTARNIISGHSHYGIEIINLNQGAVIQGNYIGSDIDGLGLLGNTNGGISLLGSTETIIGTNEDGLTDNLEGNLISGNGRGIYIASNSNENTVAGNLIGTDVTGNTLLSNTVTGIEIRGSNRNHIGGETELGRNIISGNLTQGILFGGTTSQNQIYNNFIGLGKDSSTAMGNGSDGIRFTDAALDNLIGGTLAHKGNVIAHNNGDGINVVGGTGNSFRRNSIHSNTQLGIDLNNNGVTLNELLDADSGPNNLQNFPFITSAQMNAATIEINGKMYSEPSKTYELEFFANSTADPSNHGEGMKFIGTTSVTTDASGVAAYTITFNEIVPAGYFISATATDPDQNTSEFSGPYGDPLPVEIIHFEAVAHQNEVQLKWDVAQEINVARYMVYASANGVHFESIGYITANGSPEYRFKDALPQGETIYYKLKVEDIDGSFAYSPVRVIELKDRYMGISIYPNPASDHVYIHAIGCTFIEANIQIINTSGTTVYEENYKNSSRITIPLAPYSTGLYYVLIRFGQEYKKFPLHIVR